MTTDSGSITDRAVERPMSWIPMLVVALAQILIAFNVNALRISVGGIVASFETSPSIVGTAIVTHLLFIAALVIPVAKIGALWGPRLVFRAAALLFGAAMVMTTRRGVLRYRRYSWL